MSLKKFAAIGGAFAIIAGVAFAAATGDRLKSPVQVGQGLNVGESVQFDQGQGANNASITVDTNHSIIAYTPGVGVSTGVPTLRVGNTNNAGTDYLLIGGAVGPGLILNTTGSDYAFLYPTASQMNIGFRNNNLVPTAPAFHVTPTSVVADQKMIVPTGTPSAPGLFGSSSSTSGIVMDTASVQLVANSTHSLTVSPLGATINGDGGGNVPHGCHLVTHVSGTIPNTVTCGTNEFVTGGGCSNNQASTSAAYVKNYPSATNAWSCEIAVGSVFSNTAYAICCLQ